MDYFLLSIFQIISKFDKEMINWDMESVLTQNLDPLVMSALLPLKSFCASLLVLIIFDE